MIRLLMSLSLASVILLLSCTTAPAQTPPPQPAPPAPPAAPAQAHDDTEEDAEEVLKAIAGKENLPAEEVFKNIQVMKGVPAGRLVRIMQVGYSKGLGVGCEHCHVEGTWDADEKRPKRAAREMIAMVRAIREDHLKKMKHLDTEQPTINCTTCHRGQIEPALDLK